MALDVLEFTTVQERIKKNKIAQSFSQARGLCLNGTRMLLWHA